MAEPPRHPAKWSQAVLDRLAPIAAAEHQRLGRPLRILDPFAGTDADRLQGAIEPHGQVVGVELEAEWAAANDRTIVGDALNLRFSASSFDAIITSPTYGNRMADDHDARDDSRRNTYRHALGHELTDGTSANLQWGSKYKAFHQAFVVEALRVLRPEALLAINIKNHIRGGQEQLVAEWWLTELLDYGLSLVEVARVETPGLRFGQNHEARVDGELIIVTRTPEEP